MQNPWKPLGIVALLVVLTSSALLGVDRIPGDIDADGDVDFNDFLIFAQNFGRSGPAPTEDTTEVVVRDTVRVFETIRPEVMASWADVVDEVESSVYWVGVTFEPVSSIPNPSLTFVGTAFGIDVDAIATNAHVGYRVVELMGELRDLGLIPVPVVIRASSRSFLEGTFNIQTTEDGSSIIGWIHPLYDSTVESPDVTILPIAAESDTISWVWLLPTKEAKGLKTGDEIATLGFPGELERDVARFTERIPTLKTGIISALRPYKDTTPSHRITNRLVQHDFDTTGGTSGSPIFNLRGEVIAINHAGFDEGSLGFAIRADELREMIEAIQFELGTNPVNAKAAVSKPTVGGMLRSLALPLHAANP